MMKCVIFMALFGLSLGFALRKETQKLPTFGPDLPKYLGRWYQVYGNAISGNDYDEGALCNSATYELVNDTTISVYNSNRIFAPDGIEIYIRGYAWTTNEPGKLNLQLFPLDIIPLPIGTYWIIMLGPKTFGEEGLHEYSVVTTAKNDALYVLTRDYKTFKTTYEKEVLDFLRKAGFYDTEDKTPKAIYHGDDCAYP